MLTLNSQKPDRSLWVPVFIIIVGLALVVVYVGAMLILPTPKPVVTQTIKSSDVDSGKFAQMSWPKSQQAAVGIDTYPTIVTGYTEEKPVPIASVAKIITSLAVLKKKPLQQGEQGPEITLGANDVALYNSYKAKGGSVVKVVVGEKISQYQAMQAMLLPSANNMAASLANWAFGSEAEYTEYANKMLADLGLKNTHVDDASGFSPKTVSTASDLVALGKLAIKNPVLAEITNQTEATVPTAGRIETTNAVLGKAGINGIKTGHTPESGGCFLFSAQSEIDGQKVSVIGAILAAPTIEDARAAAPTMVQQSLANVTYASALGPNVTVATVTVPWAEPIKVVAQKGLTQTVWRSVPLSLSVKLNAVNDTGDMGTATLGDDSTDLVLEQKVPQPTVWWRLLHPLEMFTGN